MKSVLARASFVEFTKDELSQSIPSRFERIAETHSGQEAISASDGRLTYDELQKVSNRLARDILDASGDGPEPIALLLEHGAAAIVAILAVLKAGKIYVPMDPSHPAARNRFILDDTAARLVITNTRNLALAQDLAKDQARLVNVDAIDASINSGNIGLTIPPDASAYIIYTSGSTGQPKGVLQNHRNVLHRVRAYTNSIHICGHDRLALLYSYSSSGACRDIFSALLNGATLAPFDIREGSWERLAEWLAREEITVYNSAATIFRHFAGALPERQAFPKLRSIHVGSETIHKSDVELYKSRFSSECTFVARLGCTEVSPIREFPIQKETVLPGSTVPAGYAVDETDVLLIDDEGHEVGFDTVGEIAVRSPYLFPGYWHRPDLTQAALVPDPQFPNQRIYRTGDLGRMRRDGCLEHIGRKDFQVKIRGHRIELEEIEIALLQCPSVRQAIVVAGSDGNSGQQLVAYLRTAGDATKTEEIRKILSARLPAYMIPSKLIVLDTLPLLPNGKVDRKALSRPEFLRSAMANPDGESQAPRNPLESALARIWAETLRSQSVDIGSNFFDLGGDSLLAMQIVSVIHRDLNLDLPVKTLFEYPSVSRLADAILGNATDEEVRTIMERAQVTSELADERAVPAIDDESIPITARNALDPVPLSLTQEQMWFIDQLSPGSPTYNMARAFRLEGPLQPAALERSLNEVIRRHESLRTTFVAVDGVPMQMIARSLAVAIPTTDLTAVPPGDRPAEAERQIRDQGRRPYDLAAGPLVRCNLFKLTEGDHILLIGMHHIISDGWSWGVLLKELSALYVAFSLGKTSPLDPVPFQYADFVQWRYRWLQGDTLKRRLEYWTKQLAGAPAELKLPTDYPRPTVQTFRGALESQTFSHELTEKLKELSRREGVTLYMTLLAAIDVLLYRWTGQEDIVVASSIAGRNRSGAAGLIGLFINTLALRTDLSGNPTFRELLRRVREMALGSYANQELPFEKLNEELRSNRSLRKAALFQVFFVLNQESWQKGLQLPGITVSDFAFEMGTAKFDWGITMIEKTDGLTCKVHYRTDLFEAATIKRMLAHLRTLMEGAVANPASRLSELPMLQHDERFDLLIKWNDTRKPYPSDKCIHHLFEEQVDRTPDSTAVQFKEQRLSYLDLDIQANRLARRLKESGVQPGNLVCICMERSLNIVVAMLGVLKAGAAYVPVDRKYATERLAWILNETQAAVLLTEQRTVGSLRLNGIPIICVDTDLKTGKDNAARAAVETTPESLAYIIYTSGSTGTPKGVEITHRSVVNFVVSTCATFALERSDRILQFASISFDTSVEEIFPCLVRGATLVLRADDMLDSAPRFLQRCRDLRITVLDLPTAYWDELTEAIASEHLTLPEPLRLVVMGGEKASAERVAQWLKHSNDRVRLLNTYGPTEATVVATVQELSGPDDLPPDRVPIGRPISNTQTYIVDRHMNPVPIGVCGELYIGGVGLSRGYYRRPDLTAQEFVPNPFTDQPGERLYRTGDLARYLPDGSIEFMGRLDFQVKIRGFRIEPAEVETVLRRHSMVRQCAVLAQQDKSGNKRLVAYVVVSTPGPATEKELLSFARQRLPDYMVPAVMVFLDALPLTASGKVDRQALPEPELNRHQPEKEFVAPRTPLEQRLTREWEDLLGVRPIGITESFFDLGGHSLLAIRLIARMEKTLKRTIPVAALFQSPSIEQLAAMLERAELLLSSLVPVQTAGSRLPFFWVHGDISNGLLPRYLGMDQPLYAIEHQGADGHAAANTRVETMAAHYLKEIRTVQARGPFLIGGYSFGAVAAFEMAQQLRREGEEVGLLFMLDPPSRRKEQPKALHNEIQRHLRTVESLGSRQKLQYVAVRLRAYMENRIRGSRVNKTFKNLLGKAYLAGGRPLPPSIRSRYILRIYREALRCYSPQQYPDSATIFRGYNRSYDPRQNWPQLVSGELEIHEGPGDHMNIRTEPFMIHWAARLKECLEKANENARVKRPRH